MESGKGGPFRHGPRPAWLGLLLWLLAGCATSRPQLEQAILTHKNALSRNVSATDSYLVNCPDVLEVTVEARPDLSGRHEIGPDGRVPWGNLDRVRVEGQSVSQVARVLAEEARVPTSSMQVHVVEYRSQQIYLVGQVVGLQRAVVYRGSETVLDLLQRVGGITPGAAPNEVYVVRSHMPKGMQPQVFRVDLQAILLENDSRTNIPLQPLDQVFVGETRRFSLVKCFPPWLRPMYETLCGLRRWPSAILKSGEKKESNRAGQPGI